MRYLTMSGLVLATFAATPAQALHIEEVKPAVYISINKTTQTMNVSVNGKPTYTWRVSTGTRKYATPSGNFYPYRVHRYWWSRQWDNAPMHWALFFHNGFAIHGTDYIRTLGLPASHGCVRLHPRNAATLFALVNKHGAQRTRITLYGTPRWGAPVRSRARVAGYSRRSRGNFGGGFGSFAN